MILVASRKDFVVLIDVEIEGSRVALALASDVVLANLIVGDERFAGIHVLVPNKFHIVGTCG